MQQLNIHWKGYPHHNLPRIRVASSHQGSAHSHFHSQPASRDAVRLPFSSELEKCREQQLSGVRLRKRSSRRSSTIQRRASQHVEWDVGVFRLSTPHTVLVEGYEEGDGCPSPVNRNLQSSHGPECFTDVLLSTVIPPKEICDEENCYSLVHTTRTPVYQSKRKLTRATPKENRRSFLLRRTGGEYAHARQTNLVSKNRAYDRLPTSKRSHTYDPRLPIKATRRRTKSTLPLTGISSKRGNKATADFDPTNLSLYKLISTSTSPRSPSMEPSTLPSVITGVYSRTPSERKALDRFSRDLERHIIASQAIHNASLSTTTSSASCLSVHTIVEFIPYLAEFQAAGLAVTSAEQRNLSSKSSKSLPPLPVQRSDTLNGRGILANARENEKSAGNTYLTKTRCYDYTETSSSDMTIIEFTSIEDLPITMTVETFPPQRTLLRKPLPWLRKGIPPDPLQNSKHAFTHTNDAIDVARTPVTAIIESNPERQESRGKQKESSYLSPYRHSSNTKSMKVTSSALVSRNTVEDSLLSTPAPSRLAKAGDLKIIRPVTVINEEFEVHIPMSDLRSPGRAPQQTKRRQANGNITGSATKGAKRAGNRRATFPTTQSAPNAQTPAAEYRASQRHIVHRKCARGDTIPIGTAEKTHEFKVGVAGPVLPLEQEAISRTRYNQYCNCSIELKSHTMLRKGESGLDYAHRISDHCQKCGLSVQVSHTRKPHCCSHRPKLNGKPPDIHILDTYGHNNFSACEKVPKDDCYSAEQRLIQSETVADVATKSLPRGIGDPVKRRSAVGCKLSPRTYCQYDSTAANTVTTTISDSEISDREVFSGLQVALAAVCDRDIDTRIKENSGYSVRRFLADLRDFEDLGVSALAGVAMKTAQKHHGGYGGPVDVQVEMREGVKTEYDGYVQAREGPERISGPVNTEESTTIKPPH